MSKVWSTYYHTDDFIPYAVQINKGWTTLANHPWDVEDPSGYPLLPAGLRMRQACCVNAAGRHRNIPIQNPTTWRTVWSIGHTFTMPNNDGTTTVWTIIGKIDECYNPARYRRHQRRN